MLEYSLEPVLLLTPSPDHSTPILTSSPLPFSYDTLSSESRRDRSLLLERFLCSLGLDSLKSVPNTSAILDCLTTSRAWRKGNHNNKWRHWFKALPRPVTLHILNTRMWVSHTLTTRWPHIMATRWRSHHLAAVSSHQTLVVAGLKWLV